MRSDLNNNKELEFIIPEIEYIEYIILEKKKEIIPFIKSLKNLGRYSDDQLDILISKIITSEQILNDF